LLINSSWEKGVPIASTQRVGLWERISSDLSVPPTSAYLGSQFSSFPHFFSALSFFLYLTFSSTLDLTTRSPSPPFLSSSSRASHRFGATRRQTDQAERVESQPDRLRCNWRAHYLVLSHRDNYPRGRFRAPGLGLKVRRRDRRAGARRFTKYSDFFQARQRERVSPP